MSDGPKPYKTLAEAATGPKTLAEAVSVDDACRIAKVIGTALWWCPRCADYYGAADAVAHAEKHRSGR